ncbi:MAG: class I SAM-dependent rRNA methyltransferase [Bacilli bacterium]
MATAQAWLTQSRKRRLEAGHPWIFRSEIAAVRGEAETGDTVTIHNHQGHYLATGFFHQSSQIALRVASYSQSEQIDAAWLKRRVTAAWAYRKRMLAHTDCCRALHGDADGVSGLIVDKYGPVAVVQILSAAMDARRDMVVAVLRDVLGVTAIYERSDEPVRALEGLEERVGCLWGHCPAEVEIQEHGLKFNVDIAAGQKTGHFFDQRDNREAIAPLVRWAVHEKPRPDQRYPKTSPQAYFSSRLPVARSAMAVSQEGRMAGQAQVRSALRQGAEVLDCFCHTGAFALHALRYGARRVTAIDRSEEAIAGARRNAELNGVDERCEFVVANVFDALRDYEREQRRFDAVILDPPAFAKSRGAREAALRGYKEINLRALKLIRPGGFLATASCSFHVSRADWRAIIAEAALDARKILRMIEERGAAPDHPQLAGMPENDYLKFAMYQVLERA